MCTTAVTVSRLKDEVRAAIEERSGAFVRLAHDIHAHSELALAEEYAAERITDVLVDEGFTVLWGVVGVPTAFVASLGNGSLHIAFCAERDALDDDIGHGCRHNLIAGVAVAAAVGLKGIVDEVGLTVSVIGTPGEELVGPKEPPAGHLVVGKIALLDAGAFCDIHAALMVHPGIGGTAPHSTAEFTAQADTDEAYRAMLDGGVALAWTALDAATDPAVRSYLLERARLRCSS